MVRRPRLSCGIGLELLAQVAIHYSGFDSDQDSPRGKQKAAAQPKSDDEDFDAAKSHSDAEDGDESEPSAFLGPDDADVLRDPNAPQPPKKEKKKRRRPQMPTGPYDGHYPLAGAPPPHAPGWPMGGHVPAPAWGWDATGQPIPLGGMPDVAAREPEPKRPRLSDLPGPSHRPDVGTSALPRSPTTAKPPASAPRLPTLSASRPSASFGSSRPPSSSRPGDENAGTNSLMQSRRDQVRRPASRRAPRC